MLKSLLLFSLLLPVLARADIKWTSTTAFAAALPDEGPATTEFTFTNTGSYPVKITGTRTSCGCTAAVADDKTIAPGQIGKIAVSFKTLNRHGLFEEPIDIETNDPNALKTTVTLRVMVRDAVTLLPTLLFWQPGEPLTAKVIYIDVTDGFGVKDVNVACANPNIAVQVEPVKNGGQYKVTVTPRTPHVKATLTVTPTGSDRPLKPATAHLRVS